MRKFCFFMILFLFLINSISFASQKTTFSKESLLYEIYSTDHYKMYESKLLDTYFIACALYFNFESPDLLPDTENSAFYKKVKTYFAPFQTHPFIKNFGRYADKQNNSLNFDVVSSLLMYAFSQTDYNTDVNMIQNNVFENAEQFHEFLNGLYQFYVDTNAKQFFDSLDLQKEMVSYVQKNAENIPIEALILEMESYVGNKEKLFEGQNIQYCSVMTLFRPFNASFYRFYFGNDIYFVGQQSPNDETKKPEAFDMQQTVSTTIHEFLHNFINQPVYEQNELILKLSKDKQKSDYTNAIYENMPWNRIADETIVRVLETEIYKNVLQDEQKAIALILEKEIEYSGMPNLQKMYNALKIYENDRNKYKTIDDFLPKLITVLFESALL